MEEASAAERDVMADPFEAYMAANSSKAGRWNKSRGREEKGVREREKGDLNGWWEGSQRRRERGGRVERDGNTEGTEGC